MIKVFQRHDERSAVSFVKMLIEEEHRVRMAGHLEKCITPGGNEMYRVQWLVGWGPDMPVVTPLDECLKVIKTTLDEAVRLNTELFMEKVRLHDKNKSEGN